MKINLKKSGKLIMLLLSSLIIAAVSADVYRYMYIDGSITVGSPQLIWILGSDAPGDASIAGSTAIIDLDVEQGVPINFTETLFLKNNNTGSSISYNLTSTAVVASADFQRANMHIYQNYTVPGTWNFLATMDLTDISSFYAGSLPNNSTIRITFEVNATIATGARSFDIQVEY
jgi:hypothetical protein